MKKSFTLIEIILSVVILSFLFLAMANVIKEFKGIKKSLQTLYLKNEKKDLLLKTLYYDLLNSKKIKIVKSFNKNFVEIFLVTSNSLYGFYRPYVAWYVSKNGNTLIRVENKYPFNFPSENLFYIDKFSKNVKIFKVYKKNNKLFVFIKIDSKPIFFEMIKGDY